MTLLQLVPCALAALPILLSGCGSGASSDPTFPNPADLPKATWSGTSRTSYSGGETVTRTFNNWQLKEGLTLKTRSDYMYENSTEPVGEITIYYDTNHSTFLTRNSSLRDGCTQLMCVPPGSAPAPGPSCTAEPDGTRSQPVFDGKKPCSGLCSSSKDSCDVWSVSYSYGPDATQLHVPARWSLIKRLAKAGDDINYTAQDQQSTEFQYYFKAGSDTLIGLWENSTYRGNTTLTESCFSKWDTTSDILESLFATPKEWLCPAWPPNTSKATSMANAMHTIIV